MPNTVTASKVIRTQKAIAAKIVAKRADYVLALKENQGTLYADVADFFAVTPLSIFSSASQPKSPSSANASRQPSTQSSVPSCSPLTIHDRALGAGRL